ncbi:phospholipid-binding protein MlaC [Thorsellia kenyensis]|uniref:Phospholipid-binding protein MlaC n=1 Tax=Thorsellia kenyensis TaxID=1549888 RepID=A0ABV6CBL2_9GAMM
MLKKLMLKLAKMKYALFVLFTLSTFNANAVDATNPYALMNEVAAKVFDRMKNEQTQIKQNPEQLKNIVREELLPYIHVKYAGALVLGRYYQSASEQEKEAFFKAFENYLVQVYAQALASYTDQTIDIAKEQPYADKETTSIRVTINNNNGRPPIRLDFAWRKNSKSGEWQAYDMTAEGISMVSTKQSEWSGLIKEKGVSGLTEQLQRDANLKVTLGQ